MEFSVNLDLALSPNHYIEISPAPNFTRLSTYPQHILLLCEDENKHGTLVRIEKKDSVTSLEKSIFDAFDGARLSCFFWSQESLEKDLSAIPETHFSQVVYPGENIEVVEKILAILTSRWACHHQLDGHLFVAASSKEACLDLANLNSKHLSIIWTSDSPTPQNLWAATLAATNANEASQPQRPYTAYVLPNLKPPTRPPTLAERDELLAIGVSTFRVQGNSVIMDRLVTTQTKSLSGVSDKSMRDLNTKQILSYLRYDLRESLSLNFSRCALARDEFPYSDLVVTPQTIKAFLLVKYRKWQEACLVQDPGDQFAKNLSVTIDPKDENALIINLPVCVMGQLYVTKTKINFSK